jgi:hypothetical protein
MLEIADAIRKIQQNSKAIANRASQVTAERVAR